MNVLVIACTEQAQQSNQATRTPSLDALAESGVRFVRAYAQSTNAETSYRSLMTGRRPVFEKSGETRTSMVDHFASLGYVTAVIQPNLDRQSVESLTARAIEALRKPSTIPFMVTVRLSGEGNIPSTVDGQVGRLVGELERLGIAANTIVVFASMSATTSGTALRAADIERQCLATLIVNVPGRSMKTHEINSLVELVDVFPTVAQLAGVEPPCGLQGTSLIPLLERPDGPWKHAAFSEICRPLPAAGTPVGYSTRNDRYRYIQFNDVADHREPSEQLFDFEALREIELGTSTAEAEAALESLRKTHVLHFHSDLLSNPVLNVWEWTKSREVALELGNVAMSLGFYEWTFFDAIKRGEHHHGQRMPKVVSASPEKVLLAFPDEGMELSIQAVSDGAELLLKVTNMTNYDWPAESGLVPCYNPGVGEHRSEAFVNFETFFAAPEGLYALNGREIHFNTALEERVRAWAQNRPHSFARKWPIASPSASEGIMIRESADCRWVSGIAWERFLSSQGNNVRVCMHLAVQVGPLKRGETKTIRGKAYLFEGDKEECLRRYRAEFN